MDGFLEACRRSSPERKTAPEQGWFYQHPRSVITAVASSALRSPRSINTLANPSMRVQISGHCGRLFGKTDLDLERISSKSPFSSMHPNQH